jgi:predicted DNA-binding ribbon-helix-helix protein
MVTHGREPPLTHNLMLELSNFTWEMLSEAAARRNVSPEGLVQEAVTSYLSQKDVDRAALRVPKFARGEPEPGSDAERRPGVAIELDEAELAELGELAEAQQVPVERLVNHAVLLLIADLDRKRRPPAL